MCANSHTSDLKWDDLKAFLAVARLGRLTVAARHIGLDHSTLSRRITALETSLRVPLFERSPAATRSPKRARSWLPRCSRWKALLFVFRRTCRPR
ncbi:LysR family transcriptional regulator [Ochrobactrum oryzae]|nr:LysR family transcriptional regulator [Brucella oryzae]